MKADESDFLLDPPPDAIQFVRKRDGTVEGFDAAKLVASIYNARQQEDAENAAFHAQELAQAVLHFLVAEFAGQIPRTQDIFETVVKVLREIGHGPTAAIYYDFSSRRHEHRQQMQVFERIESSRLVEDQVPLSDDQPPAERVESWDKGRIVWTLQTEADVDPTTAREIAARIERKLLACELHRIPVGIIRELIDYELMELGLYRALHRRRFLGVPTHAIEQLLRKRPVTDPHQLHVQVGREIMQQFAMQEVFTPDIAGLHREGLLHLFDADCPAHWSALSIDLVAVAARSNDPAAFLAQLEDELEQTAVRVEGTIAIDGLDAQLALIADSAASINGSTNGSSGSTTDLSPITDQLVAIFHRITRRHRVVLNLNLYGRVPDSIASQMSEGPLFSVQPTELQDRIAHRLAQELGEHLAQDARLNTCCRIDFHPPLHSDHEQMCLEMRSWAKLIARGANIRFSFDHDRVWLAEGVPQAVHGRAAVYQYVGIRLPLLYRRLGPGTDADILGQRLGLLCESSIRAGVQKREFLRRQQAEFLTDREHSVAAVVVVPLGLDILVQEMVGKPLAEDDGALALAEQVLSRMAHRLHREGRHYQLECLVDGIPAQFENTRGPLEYGDDPHRTAGCTPAMAAIAPLRQIKAGGHLHTTVRTGTTICRLTEEGVSTEAMADRILELAALASSKTGTCRLAFQMPRPARQRKLVKDW